MRFNGDDAWVPFTGITFTVFNFKGVSKFLQTCESTRNNTSGRYIARLRVPVSIVTQVCDKGIKKNKFLVPIDAI